MSKRYFGTDGVRGTANTPPMTAETALRLGLAAGAYFRAAEDRRHLVVIGNGMAGCRAVEEVLARDALKAFLLPS